MNVATVQQNLKDGLIISMPKFIFIPHIDLLGPNKDKSWTSKSEDKTLDSDELVKDNAIMERCLLANQLLASAS